MPSVSLRGVQYAVFVTDRRAADRRQRTKPTSSERRHGDRRTYQKAGCRCLLCRAANAYYIAKGRHDKAVGKAPLGSLVDATPTWKQIERLRIEGLTYGALALKLGLRWPVLQLHTDRITLRNYLKVRRVYRTLMTEDRPNI